MSKEIKNLDLIIIGGGPAGLTAAIYGSRAKLDVLLIEDAVVGGQVRTSYLVENYPGFVAVDGNELADKIQSQAIKCGAKIEEFDNIVAVKFTDEEKIVETESYIYKPKAVIVATGAVPKKLPIKEESYFQGKGVHYCALCDGAMYEGKKIGVIGGGNSALEEAIFLSKFGKVSMIRRFDYFKGEKLLIDEVMKNPNIEILWNHDIKGLKGDKKLEQALVENIKTGETSEIRFDGIFVYIGSEPKTSMFREILNINPQGYIITDEKMNTNIKGVFAAGDVREKLFRQITTAVSDGTIAALMAEKYINEKGRLK